MSLLVPMHYNIHSIPNDKAGLWEMNEVAQGQPSMKQQIQVY